MEPVMRAIGELGGDAEKKKKKADAIAGKKEMRKQQRVSTRRGLRGRPLRETRLHKVGGRGRVVLSNMASGHDSSSEATESNDKAVAAGMLKLAVACSHVQEQPAKEPAGAEEKRFEVDSSEEELQDEEPLVHRRTKRRKGPTVEQSPTKLAGGQASTHEKPPWGGNYGGNWSWVPAQSMLPQNTATPPPWAKPPPPYPLPSQESEERMSRRKRRNAYEAGSRERSTRGSKPNRVQVNEVGEVDVACEGKNAWDEAIRKLVPLILDVSVVEWSKQSQTAVKKLKEALDNEFDYVGQPLSMLGFKTAITRFLKSERSRLKAKWLKGVTKCPLNVEFEDQWERLIAYWETDAQQLKAQKMQAARQSVKNNQQGGRRGKAGKELASSSGTMDLADGTGGSPTARARNVGVGAGDSSLRSAEESLKRDIDDKLTQVVATSIAQSAALDDLRSMFQSYMGMSKQKDEGRPSITQSALENQGSGGVKVLDAAGVLRSSRRKVVAVSQVIAKHTGTPKENLAATTKVASKSNPGALTTKADVMNLSDLANEQEADEEADDYGEEGCPTDHLQPLSFPQGYAVDNDNAHEDVMSGSSDEGEDEHAMQETANTDGDHVMTVEDWEIPDESAKRRERRQAQAAREREGDRRRKDGLRRNYLLVDEYTHKPYGTGVGEWRKEIMLLSRILDPAIGNINRQPDGAVAEIAEWIEQTWEYSSPIKFEFVKEVVARGVALRRADIWNKIRNKQPKPEKLSDRSWRSLEKQLLSPATIQKSENCSKANAARVNFGRTGPSGEVGVRERLRKMLRRSPEPEEIQREMSRNKGYGGRSLGNSKHLSVMHGSVEHSGIGMPKMRMTEPIEQVQEKTTSVRDCDGQEEDIGDKENREMCNIGGSGEGCGEGVLMNMPVEEISKHPLVLKLMQRLEALEGLQAARDTEKMSPEKPDDVDGGTQQQRLEALEGLQAARDTEKMSPEKPDDVDGGTQQQRLEALEGLQAARDTEKMSPEKPDDVDGGTEQQDDGDSVQLQEKTAPRKVGRPRKKPRNN